MAGAACKIIINDLTRAISESLEKILTSPLIRDQGKITSAEADAMLSRLVDFEIAGYQGAATGEGLVTFVHELVDRGIITDEIWKVLAP